MSSDPLPLGAIRWERFGKTVARGGSGLKLLSLYPLLPFTPSHCGLVLSPKPGDCFPQRHPSWKSQCTGVTGVVEYSCSEPKQLSFECALEGLEQCRYRALGTCGTYLRICKTA